MKKSVRIFWASFFSAIGLFLLIILLALFGVFGPLPSLEKLENPSILQASEVYAGSSR